MRLSVPAAGVVVGEYPAWAPPDVTKLKRLVARKLSATRIAIEFNGRYSRNAVIGKCYREGLQLQGNSRYCNTPAARSNTVKLNVLREGRSC